LEHHLLDKSCRSLCLRFLLLEKLMFTSCF
jgi:hypothetical protein